MRRPNPLRAGFSLLEIMVAIAIMGLILALALPNLLKSRIYAQRQICIENLGQIESAKQIWGLEHGKQEGDAPTVSELIGINGYIKKQPICPSGGLYDFKPIGEKATCIIPDHVL